MMENRPPLTSPDGSRNRNTPERCPRPLYSRDTTQEDQEIPQARPLFSRDSTQEHQEIPQEDESEVLRVKVEVKEEAEEPYMTDDEPCKEEETPPEISTDPGHSRDSQRDVKVEVEEEGHVRIKEEEIPPEISTVEDVKKRWRSYKDSYGKLLRSQRQEGRSGSARSRRQEYVFFRQLSFLRPIMALRRTHSHFDEEQEEAAGPSAGGNTAGACEGDDVSAAGAAAAVGPAEAENAAEQERTIEDDRSDSTMWAPPAESTQETQPNVDRASGSTPTHRQPSTMRRSGGRGGLPTAAVEQLLETVRFFKQKFTESEDTIRNVALSFVPYLQLVPAEKLCACATDMNRVLMGFQNDNPLLLIERERASAVPPLAGQNSVMATHYQRAPPQRPYAQVGRAARAYLPYPPHPPQPYGSYLSNPNHVEGHMMGGEQYSPIRRPSGSWSGADDTASTYCNL